MRSIGASIAGGFLLVLGFPPFGWAPLAWVGVGVLLWAWRLAENRRVALLAGYAAGLSFFGGLFWWLVNVELIAFVPLLLVQAVFFVWIAWVTWWTRNRPGWLWVVAVAGAWALSEIVRVRAPVGGFPWGVLGLTIEPTPLLASSQWIGATGWSVVFVALAATVVAALERRIRPMVVGAMTAAVFALGAAGLVWPAPAEGAVLRIAVVQGNSPCPGSTCPGERSIIFENHLALTRTLSPGELDVVIWPESATGFSSDPLANPDVAQLIGDEVRRLGAFMLVGGDRSAGDSQFVNSNVLFDPSGDIVAEYRKTHPVPFGEYVPARPLLQWIPALDRVPRDMVRGDGPVTFDLGNALIGSVISYEGSFARYPRAAVRSGAGVVVVATNQASFGDSPASGQFLAMSRVRSAELGTDVVHAAVTGKSAILHADGRVDGPTGLFSGEVLTGSVAIRSAGLTVYALVGDWLQALAAVAGLAVLVGPRVKSSRENSTS